MGDLFGIDAVILVFAAVNGLEIERVSQNESEVCFLAGIGQPIPAEHAFSAHRQVVLVRFNALEKISEVIVLDVGMDQLLALAIHHADIHLPGVEVDSAVEFCGGGIILHNDHSIGAARHRLS